MPSGTPMQNSKNRSLAARTRFAMAGFAHGLRSERSLRTELLCFAGVLLVLGWLRPAPLWWGLVILVSATVIAAELINTALERLADRLHPEEHPDIRVVKDCAAAAVLAVVTGAIGISAVLAWTLWHG